MCPVEESGCRECLLTDLVQPERRVIIALLPRKEFLKFNEAGIYYLSHFFISIKHGIIFLYTGNYNGNIHTVIMFVITITCTYLQAGSPHL